MKKLLVGLCLLVLVIACAGVQTVAAPTAVLPEPKPVVERYLDDGTRLLNLCECMELDNAEFMCAVAEAVHPADESILQWLHQIDPKTGKITIEACALIGRDSETGTYVFGGFVENDVCYDLLNRSAQMYEFNVKDVYRECESL